LNKSILRNLIMKLITHKNTLLAALIAGVCLAGAANATPWVYRGNLQDGDHEANGAYDLRITLVDAMGSMLASPVTLSNVKVEKGSFQTQVDFGVDIARLTGAKIKTEVSQGSSGFVQLGEPKALPNPQAPNAGICWDTDGNLGVANANVGTNDAASDLFTRLRSRGETKLYLRAGGGVEMNSSSAPGFDAVAFGYSTAAGEKSFAVGGGRTGAGGFGSFAYSDTTAPAAPFTPGYSNQPGEFLVNASGGMAIHAVPSGYGTLGPDVTDLTIGVKSSGIDADVDIVMRTRSGLTGALALSDSLGSFNLYTVPTAGMTRYLRTSANGAYLSTGGIWTNGSSRTFKKNFTPVNPLEMLNKVAALPLSTWNYKNAADGLHVGPMAEDFKAAFGLGSDAQHIGTVDADGVALAAIQGLNQKLETENAALKARLDALEQRMTDADKP
jgi:hypothetical protein